MPRIEIPFSALAPSSLTLVISKARGLAGVIKAVLVLEKGLVPPNADFRKQSQTCVCMNATSWSVEDDLVGLEIG